MDSPPTLDGVSLLLVEDNRDVAEMTAIALEGYGAEVHCAYTGSDALATVSRGPVDVAILDLGLPDMRGAELASELRLGKAVGRIIALTGFDDADGDQARLFDVFLQKPISASDLARVITEVRGRSSSGEP